MIDTDMNSPSVNGSVRPFNYQQMPMQPRSPFAPWQAAAPTRDIKNEPMDEDKNDSGVASGSDFHSSSPESDTSQDQQAAYQTRFYTPAMMAMCGVTPYPLTPPTSEPLVSPKSEKGDTSSPCASPKAKEENHIQRLEMTLQKSLHCKEMEESKSDEDLDERLKVPKVNSHGKVKTFKCKQCDFVASTKVEQWNHTKIHIREDKRLNCPKCPFVTEYKHHLEYHLRNHAGSKPFQCKKCDYSCVNKSMLNSHMKSHSNVYRFKCQDCTYASKYCHSLKLHLRRYTHNPSVVLDESGKPCPEVIIDVYGTRRGPKIKTPKREEPPPQPQQQPAFNMPPLPFPAYPFLAGFPTQVLQQLMREREAEVQNEQAEDSTVLDLSKPEKSRRKGPAFRVDPAAAVNESEDEEETTMFSNVEVVQQEEPKSADDEASDTNNNDGEKNCQYCNIAFGDDVLYTIHMGYHGFRNPFTCNMCGVECSDKVSFFLHIARVSHS